MTARGYVGNKLWVCDCECGAEVYASGTNLRSGSTKSCGCLRRELVSKAFKKHGMRASPEYRIWTGMKQRCTATRGRNYRYYASRGVKVCPEWNDFTVFYRDMGPRPGNDYSIDRIDTNKGYSPGNCRWATRDEQARNKSNAITITYRDVPLSLVEVANFLGFSYYTLREKLDRAVGLEKGRTKGKTIK